MAVGATNYPTSLDTTTELIQVVNNASNTVGTGGCDAVVTTIPVTDTTVAPSSGVAYCGTEAISYTGKTSTSLTGAVRGFDGTTAASHAAGDPIYFDVIISAHHEALRGAIIALETLLGAAGGNVVLKSGGVMTGPLAVRAGTGNLAPDLSLEQYSADVIGTELYLQKSRNATPGSHTVVQLDDILGILRFTGSDGAAFINGAAVIVRVDGTPGTNDMPGRIELATTADGGTSPTTRATIKAAGGLILAAGGVGADSWFRQTAGTLLTTPEAGAREFDGVAVYNTIDTTNGRAHTLTQQEYRLTADSSALASATIADFYPANSSLPTVAGAVYEIIHYLYFTKTTAGTVVFTHTSTTAPTRQKIDVLMTPVGGIGAVGTPQEMAVKGTTATALATPASGSLTTGVDHRAIVRILFVANTAGNVRLRITPSAGTVTPLADSFYVARRLPGNTGIFAT